MKHLGPYQLIERIGVGGMAEVFLAHARRQGDFVQPCVVKVLHRELAADKNFTRILLEEARLIAQLRHNNIASLYDVGRHDGAVFLVMEFVDGQDLHAVLAKSVRLEQELPVAFALHVARNLCTGLHFAHTRSGPGDVPLKLVHRDVSPQNVLISALGEVKLIDFGVAKFNSEMREKTRAGVIKGKFGYMSPEQAWDETLDQRSDLFSVGICLYEMLTGRSVYGQSDEAMTMLKRAREADIDPITDWRPDVPEDLAKIIHRALERNRDDRFQTAHQMERELSVILARVAPDYTNLDAGVLVDGLFSTDDPALQELSPRIGVPGMAVEEQTHPMTDVPQEIKESGRFLQMSSLKENPSAGADDATAAIIFRDEDFADEKTELFDETRISGVHPTVDRNAPDLRSSGRFAAKQRGRSAKRRDPARNTRRIEESLEDQETDPRHETPKTRASGGLETIERTTPDRARRKKKNRSPRAETRQKETDDPAAPKIQARGPVPPTELSDRDELMAEMRQFSRESRQDGDSSSKAKPKISIDPRLQLVGAASFVIIALLFVLIRFVF